MTTKRCPDCKQTLDSSFYHKNKTRKDGLQTICKSCFTKRKKILRPKYKAHESAYKKSKRERWNKLRREARRNRILVGCLKPYDLAHWRQYPDPVGKALEFHNRTLQGLTKTNPTRSAKLVVQYAKEFGQITRPNYCTLCGKICKPEGHHCDYTKPLDVTWACKKCHVELDKIRRYSESE